MTTYLLLLMLHDDIKSPRSLTINIISVFIINIYKNIQLVYFYISLIDLANSFIMHGAVKDLPYF